MSLRRDIVSGYVASGSKIASWVIVSAMIYRTLGGDAFALLTLVRSTIGLLAYASLGLGPAMIYFASRAGAQVAALAAIPLDDASPSRPLAYADPDVARRPREQYTSLQQMYWSAAWMLIVVAMVAIIPFGIVTSSFDGGVRLPSGNLRDIAPEIVLLFGAGVLARFISDASGAILAASGKLFLDNLLQALAEWTWVVLSALIVMLNDPSLRNLTGIAAASLAGAALLFAGRFYAAEKVAPIAGRRIPLDLAFGWQLLVFGLALTLSQMADFLYAPSDYLLISQFLSPAMVATYAPAVQIDAGLLILVSTLATVILPHSAIAHAAGDRAAVRRYYVRGMLASFALLLVGAIVVWLASPLLLRAWLGDSLPATRAILPLVLIHTVIGGSSMVGRSVLLAMGKVKPFAAAAILSGIANVVISYLLVRYTSLGLRGIILGTIIAVSARCLAWMPWYVWRQLRVASCELREPAAAA